MIVVLVTFPAAARLPASRRLKAAKRLSPSESGDVILAD
jgi:hypothetical protein